MAGDTFDAGTVFAESRLGRDEFARDLAALRRDIAKFERDAKITIRPEFDPKQVKTGTEQARKWLQSLSDYKATPHVELTGVEQARASAAALRAQLQELGRQTVRPRIAPDTSQAQASVKKVTKDMSDGWDEIGSKALGVLKPVGMLVGGVSAFGAASWVAAAALQVMSTAAGGMAVLPAVLAAGVITVSALKMGLNGVGDALKAAASGDAEKLNEALKKLAPNARAFVLEMQKLTPAWKAMRLDVQNALFVGLADTVGKLGRTYIPVLRTGLTDVAAELNIAGVNIAKFLLEGRQVESVRTIFQNVRAAMVETRTAGASVVSILLDVAAVGSGFLPRLAEMWNNAAGAVAAWVREARDSGQLAAIIERGLQTLFSLIGAIDSAIGIVRGVMRAAGMDGQGLAASLATILQTWENWVNSARGQQVLIDFFTQAKAVAVALAPILGIVAVAAGQMVATLLPAIPPLAKGLTDVLIAASPLLGVFGPLAAAVLPALGSALSFLAPVLGPLVAVTLAATAATKAWSLAMVFGQGVALVFSGVMKAITIATTAYNIVAAIVRGNINLWAMAQLLLNAAMTANPIGIIVVGIGLLIAALVLAWNHSETFRAVVTAAWEGIKSAAAATWSFLQQVFAALVSAGQTVGSALSTAWDAVASAFRWVGDLIGSVIGWVVDNWRIFAIALGIITGPIGLVVLAFTMFRDQTMTALRAVGDAATWLWSNILSPVFSAIGLAARILIAVLVTILLTPLILAFKGLALVATWLWESGIKPAFDAIQTGLGIAWGWIRDNVFTPIGDFISGTLVPAFLFGRDQAVAAWNAIQTGLGIVWGWILANIWNPLVNFVNGTLVPAFNFGRDQAVAAWNAIQTGLGIAWQWILDNVWNPLVNFVNGTLVPAFVFGRDQAIGAWNALRDGLATVWNWLRDNVFTPIATFVTKTIPDAFSTAVEAVKTAWGKISEIIAVPIRFMVNLVYNEGIVPAWNWIAGIVNLPPLQKVNLGFASGGVLPGYSPGRDNMLAASPFGPVALSGGEAIMRPEWTRAVGAKQIDQMNLAARRGGIRGVQDYLAFGGERSAQFAGGGVVDGQNFARGEQGKPYVWGGVGPGGYDCSGFMSAVTNVVLGLAAHSRRFATGAFGPGRGAGGFVPGTGSAFVIGVTPDAGGGIGHMAGNLGGLGIESRGGDGVVVGGGARSPTSALFPWQFYLPQVGGTFVDSGGVDLIGKLTELWKKVTDFMARVGEFTSTGWGAGAMDLLKNAVDGAWNWLLNKISFGLLGSDPAEQPGNGVDPTRGNRGGGGKFDQGGYLPTGTSVVTNATGKPEPVLTPEQWRAITTPPQTPPGPQGPGGDQIAQLHRTMTEVRDLLERRGTAATVNINGSTGSPQENARAAVLQLRLS